MPNGSQTEAGTSFEQATRDELVERHLPLVHHVARQILRTMSANVELDDLMGAGTMGLINAVEHFDASRGLAFSTYAAPRIRGAILDDLRRSDHMPRSVRRKQRELSGAQRALARELDREPGDYEMAEKIGIDIHTLWRWKSDTEDAIQVSLDQPLTVGIGRTATAADLLEDSLSVAPEERVAREEEVAILRDEILNLEERERVVLTLYYFEELKGREIAEVLGLTESRISQIRAKALGSLRVRLAHLRQGA
jgi:RNA polymerase sigma factor for flagellar operon FliA